MTSVALVECPDTPVPGAELAIIDGYLVDEAGEIHGHVNCQADFHVTTQSSAEWVMQRMLDADGIIVGIDAMERAIVQNLKRLRNQQLARLEFLDRRFASELKAFAHSSLRGKSKTWGCAFGRVSFRSLPAGIEVIDEERAIAWAKAAGLVGAVKVTEKLLVSQVKDAALAEAAAADAEAWEGASWAELNGLALRPARESVTIKTGVE